MNTLLGMVGALTVGYLLYNGFTLCVGYPEAKHCLRVPRLRDWFISALLLVTIGTLHAQPVSYDPSTGKVVMDLEAAYRLEVMARQSVVCGDLLAQNEHLMRELEGQRVVSIETLENLRTSLMYTSTLVRDLNAQLVEAGKVESRLRRQLDITQAEIEGIKRQQRMATIQWTAGAVLATACAAILIIPRPR